MARAHVEPPPGRYEVDAGVAELLWDAERTGGVELAVNGVPQSYVDTADPTYLSYAYVQLLADLVDLMPEGPLTALHLGGGACTLPRYVATTRPGSTQLVVELDARLADLVRAELGTTGFKLKVAEARATVTRLDDASSDVVVCDVFTGARIPEPVTTFEFVEQVARVLRPGGVYAMNVGDGGGLAFTRSMVSTLLAVFPHVGLIGDPGVLRGRRFGNLVLAGSHAPLPERGLRRRAARAIGTARVVLGREVADFPGGAAVIRDSTVGPTPTPPPDLFAR